MARIKAKPAIKRLPIAPVAGVQAKTAAGFNATPAPVFDPAAYPQSARYNIYSNGATALSNVANTFGVHMIVS